MSIILTIYVTLAHFIKTNFNHSNHICNIMKTNVNHPNYIYDNIIPFYKRYVNLPNYICNIRPFYKN